MSIIEKEFNCILCDFSTSLEEDIQDHIIIKHIILTDIEYLYINRRFITYMTIGSPYSRRDYLE